MAKLKTPLLSLGASQSIGDALTFQKRSGTHFVRRKPFPTDPQTLAQIYHRWLYQDYISWWHDQTPAAKQLWETNARPYHMTGFAYWMKDKLADLSDIELGLHLDQVANATAIDFSKNSRDGTIFGCTLVDGVIHKAFNFDGLDDYINFGNILLIGQGDLTIELSIYPRCWETCLWVNKGNWNNANSYWLGRYGTTANRIQFGCGTAWANRLSVHPAAFTLNHWHHIMATASQTHLTIILDDVQVGQKVRVLGDSDNTDPLRIGMASYYSGAFLDGIIDELRLSNRPLTITDAKRHSERRYP